MDLLKQLVLVFCSRNEEKIHEKISYYFKYKII